MYSIEDRWRAWSNGWDWGSLYNVVGGTNGTKRRRITLTWGLSLTIPVSLVSIGSFSATVLSVPFSPVDTVYDSRPVRRIN